MSDTQSEATTTENEQPAAAEERPAEVQAAAPDEGEAPASESEGAAEARTAEPDGEASGAEQAKPTDETAGAAEPASDEAASAKKGVKRRRKKSQYAADVTAGEAVNDVFVLQRKHLPTDRAGKRFLIATLADRTGRIEGRMWDDAEIVAATLIEGGHVRLEGQAVTFQGRLQVRIDKATMVEIDELGLAAAEFVPPATGPVDEMVGELRRLAGTVENASLQSLLMAFFDDPEWMERFRQAPAAQTVHHARIGGLAEHTLGTTRLAEQVARLYPQLDRDLTITGALLHDFGKVEELEWAGTVRYTDPGRLLGHVVLGAQTVRERASAVAGFPDDLLQQLLHILVSHHGPQELGSAKPPMTLEALVVHYADLLDARLAGWSELLDNVGSDGWTEYNRFYDRPLFRPSAGGKKRRKRRKKKRTAAAGASGESSEPARPRGEKPSSGRRAGPRSRSDGADSGRGGRRTRSGGDRSRSGDRGRSGGRDAPAKSDATLTFNPFAKLASGGDETPPDAAASPAAESAPPKPPETGESGPSES